MTDFLFPLFFLYCIIQFIIAKNGIFVKNCAYK